LNKTVFSLPALALGVTVLAHAQAGSQVPTKVGIIHIQNAILSTNDGQKAANDLQTKFAPTKAKIDKLQNEVAQIEEQIRKGSNTMSEEARQKLMRDRDQKATTLKRETEDAQAEVEQEEGKIMNDLGQRIMAVINKYGVDNGFAVIIDVSNPQIPIVYAANGIDVTKEIVDLYNKNAPAPAAPRPTTSAPPASAPAVTRPVTPPASRPVTPPAPKTTPPPTKK
jgi:outer membrane protein